MNPRLRLVAIDQFTVDAAGTQEQLSSTSLYAKSVTIQAAFTNTAGSYIYVGDSDCSSTHMVALAPGDSITIEQSNGIGEIQLSSIWLDSSANGLKANIVYLKQE